MRERALLDTAPFLLSPLVTLSGVALAGSQIRSAPGAAITVGLLWLFWACVNAERRARVPLALGAGFLFWMCAARAGGAIEEYERSSEAVRAEFSGPERCAGQIRIVTSPVQRTSRGFRGENEVRESWVGQAGPLECDRLKVEGPLLVRVGSEPMGLGRGDELVGVFQLAPLELFRNARISDDPSGAARRGVILSGGLVALDERISGNSLRRAVDWARALVRGRIVATFDPGAVPLAKALVLGETDLEDEDRIAFAASGLMHVLAVSGTHLVVAILTLTNLLRMLLVRIPRLVRRFDVTRFSNALGLPLSWLYEDFSGASGSAFRAACMLSAVLGARALGFRVRGGTALGLSILWGLAADPLLGGDLSFLLSALSTLGLLALGQPLTRALMRGRFLTKQPLRFIVENLVATVSASLGCAPAIALMNDKLTLAALIANLLAAPVGELFALPACLLHAVSAPLPDLERGLAWVGSSALLLVAWVAKWSAGVEALKFKVGLPDAWDMVFFVALGLVALGVFARLSHVKARVLGAMLTLGIGLFRYLPSAEAGGASSGLLRVTALDIGQGDALWLEFPDGKVALVDGGGYPGGKPDVAERVLLPWIRAHGVRELDLMILSHPDRDHMLGLFGVLEAIAVRELWHTAQPTEHSRELARLLELARQRGVRVRGAAELCGSDHDFGARVSVLAPCGAAVDLGRNDASLVLRVDHGAHSALLTGDIELPGEASLVAAAPDRLRSTLLKVGHHGSDTSSSRELLARVQPELAFISVGARNSFGHPKRDVLERLEGMGTQIFRTDRQGSLTFETDGRVASVRVVVR